MSYQLYWGDIHNHCGISYGHGNLIDALQRAREQLDFCSVTGHAFWPDMPTNRDQYAHIIDYHTKGFQKLSAGWADVLQTLENYNQPGKFVTFPSYEWHSREFGDHCVYYSDTTEAPLVTANTIKELRAKIEKRSGLVIPHHIGYASGYRGINWEHFDERLSPFVEIYSMHGCSESDNASYPMLHTMGPRDYRSTAQYGLQKGYRFGLVASTDHHSAYPGSWGDGRMAVYADSLTREAIWDAFLKRRVYAVTGDKIQLQFAVNDAWMGDGVTGGTEREISINVVGCDFLDKIEVVKNNRVLRRFSVEQADECSLNHPVRAKIRIEWGWGNKDVEVEWHGQLSLSEGQILSVETCFSGQPILAPQDREFVELSLPHRLLSVDEQGCTWHSQTTGNLTMKHGTTQSLIVEVEMAKDGKLIFEINGCHYEHKLHDLIDGSRSHFLRGWLTEAVRIHRAVLYQDYTFNHTFVDKIAEQEVDFYYLRVAQTNNQWAWSSPVWVSRN